MAEFDEFVKVFLGVLLGSAITIVVTFANNRAADRRLKLQLRRNDVVAALTELYNISQAKYKTYEDFRRQLDSFLQSLRSAFLPEDLKALIKKEMGKVDEFMVKAELLEPSDDYSEQNWAEAYEEWRESLPAHERAFMELKDMFRALRATLATEIERRIKET